MRKQDYFFCYSQRVAEYLMNQKKIKPITTAIEPNTRRTFSLFVQSDQLSQALKEYKNNQ
jgi:hypothetical protein